VQEGKTAQHEATVGGQLLVFDALLVCAAAALYV
jgi:hypothetical protein